VKKLAPLAWVFVLGCGGGSGGAAHLQGTVSGFEVKAAHAVYIVAKDDTLKGTVTVVIGTDDDICGGANQQPRGGQILSMSIANQLPSTGMLEYPLTPGTFSFSAAPPGRFATGLFVQNDPECNLTVNAPVVDGTIELDALGTNSMTTAKGSLSLKLGMDTITGTFTAPFCGTALAQAPAPCK
jgi:hypothetical protein